MTQSREVLVFVTGGQEWALPAHLVRQVLSPRPVTRVPGADPSLVGLIAWRGRVLEVVSADVPDVGCRTGAPSLDGAPLLVIEGGEGPVALLVDEVRGFWPVHGPGGEPGEQGVVPPPLDLGRVLGEQ
jgi:purine-binding chemotaxis protein CheW